MSPETPKPKRIRRTEISKELRAVEEVIRAIQAFDADKRKKVLATAMTMLGDEP